MRRPSHLHRLGHWLVVAAVVCLPACGGEEEPRVGPPRDDQALIAAAAKGDAATVKDLLDRGADVEARGAIGQTALVAAAFENQIDVARLLIDAGADVNVQDDSQQSAYLVATSEVGDD